MGHRDEGGDAQVDVDGSAEVEAARRSRWERRATGALVVVLAVGAVGAVTRWDSTWELVTGWGIDPVVYAALALGPLPLYWWSAFQVKDAAFTRDASRLWTWAVVNRCVAAAPLAYAVVAGSDLPGFARPLLVVYVALGVGTLAWRYRRWGTGAESGRAGWAAGDRRPARWVAD